MINFKLRWLTKALALIAPWMCATSEAAPGTLSTWGGGQTNSPSEVQGVVAVSCALDHTLAVKADGTVVAWGYDFDGQSQVPPGLSGVKGVAAGAFFSLALRADGSVVAWGDDQWGQCDVPASLANVVAVSAGRAHSLALRGDGTVAAWGSNLYGQCNVPAGLSNVRQVLARWNYSVALISDGTVRAWGVNDAGQTDVPAGLGDVVALDGGESYCVALRRDGSLVMWGQGPSLPGGQLDLVGIAAGDNHVLGVTSKGGVLAWGGNEAGQLDVPTGLAPAQAVAAGWRYSVALSGAQGGATVLRLFNPVKSGPTFSVSIDSDSTRLYYLEYSNGEANATWSPLATVGGTGKLLTLVDPNATADKRFYRVRQE